MALIDEDFALMDAILDGAISRSEHRVFEIDGIQYTWVRADLLADAAEQGWNVVEESLADFPIELGGLVLRQRRIM